MKKTVNIWEGLCWVLTCVMPGVSKYLITYPFSVVACAVVLALNVAYIVFCFKKKQALANHKRICQVLEIAFFVIIPIGFAAILFAYDIKGVNTLVY